MTTVDLTTLDIEIVIDKSGSMAATDCPGGKTRWDYAQETTLALARLTEKYDDDGINVVPFAGNFKVHEGVTADKVAQVFQEHQPMGGTNTASVLKDRFDAYFSRKASGSAKPLCLLVLTDGEPNDKAALAKVISDATQKLDSDSEIGISFIQVGHDAGATAYLKSLDDDLEGQGAKFDIVDTILIDEVENLTVEELIDKAFTD